MIKDTRLYLEKYRCFGKHMATAIDFLTNTDFSGIEPGKYTVDGDRVYAMVSQYTTRPLSEGKWEAHRQYIDIQCIIQGQEKIGYACIDRLKVTEPYDADKDALFLEGPADDELVLKAGDLVILWPEDAHRPCIAVDGPAPAKKVVIKVRL